jgi:hypothetical protein
MMMSSALKQESRKKINANRKCNTCRVLPGSKIPPVFSILLLKEVEAGAVSNYIDFSLSFNFIHNFYQIFLKLLDSRSSLRKLSPKILNKNNKIINKNQISTLFISKNINLIFSIN